MRDTPRTDAIEKNFGEMRGEMRRMERELTRAMYLVRLCRAELHEQNAITDKEYADLVQKSELRSVLETHDDLRAELANLRDVAAEMAEELAIHEAKSRITSKALTKFSNLNKP